MKFSAAFTSLVFVLPLFVGQAAAAAAQKNVGKNQGAAANNNTGAAAANSGDAQSSLTLDPAVLAKGFEDDGQDQPTAGQVASLTSKNNFINFCLTVPGLPITNGQQIKTGSCNPAPMGVIAATTNMPSSKFSKPVNGEDVGTGAFTITMNINHLETGHFTNAAETYYAAPQQVNSGGDIIGHTHFTVNAIKSFTDTTPVDPNTFAFFKGVNGAAVGGAVSEDVTAGLPSGFYKLCSINSAANHQPVLVAVAQHASLDDCVYFSVGKGAAAGAVFNGNSTGSAAAGAAAAANSTAAATGKGAAAAGKGAAAASSSSAAAAASASAAAGKGAAAGAQKGNAGQQKGAQGNKGGNNAAAAGKQQGKGQQAKGQQNFGGQQRGQGRNRRSRVGREY